MDINKQLIHNIGLDRYNHSLRVVEIAIKLAKIYGEDIEKTETAALLHDCGKYFDKISLLKKANNFDIILDSVMEANMELIHGPLGSKIAEVEYGIVNKEILNAIYCHTTGRENMTLLDKIIYIADYIEPSRTFYGIDEIRRLAYVDLDKSILKALDTTIIFLINKNKLIHQNTIKARNCLIFNNGKKGIM